MKKVLIPVCTGYEETELITTINSFKRNDISYFLWSIEDLEEVKSSHEAFVYTNTSFPTNQEFDAIFFPGGEAVNALLDYDEIIHLTKKFYEDKKIIGAICSAPKILKKAGILENKKYTCFEGECLSSTKTDKDVEVDGLIITGKNYKSTLLFAETFIELLKNQK